VGNWPTDTSLSQQMVVGTSTTVPEPSTWAMILVGFGLLGGAGYWRRRSVSIAG
jgi:hypothetical protein